MQLKNRRHPKFPDEVTDARSGVGNLTKYLVGSERLRVLPDGFLSTIIQHYVQAADQIHIDVAQLVKHSLGHLALADEVGKKPVLVYVYWTPRNAVDLSEHNRHLADIADFAPCLEPFLGFHAISYSDLWGIIENDQPYRDIIPALRSRYDIDVYAGDRLEKAYVDA